jgi:hypothetical protein
MELPYVNVNSRGSHEVVLSKLRNYNGNGVGTDNECLCLMVPHPMY